MATLNPSGRNRPSLPANRPHLNPLNVNNILKRPRSPDLDGTRKRSRLDLQIGRNPQASTLRVQALKSQASKVTSKQQPTPRPKENTGDTKSNASSLAKPPTAVTTSAKRPKLDKAAQEEEFRIKYTRAFPAWKFYFDGVPQASVNSVTRKIESLGAKIEAFMSKDVTHFITPTRIDANKENEAPRSHFIPQFPNGSIKSPIDLKSGYNPVDKARELGIKVWDINKLESVLERTLARPPAPKPKPAPPTIPGRQSGNVYNVALSRLLATEKATGATLERDPRQPRRDWTYIRKGSAYLEVLVATNDLRPVGHLQFRNAFSNSTRPGSSWTTLQKGDQPRPDRPYPTLYMDKRIRSPYIAWSKKEEAKEAHLEKREEKQRQERYDKIRHLRAQKRFKQKKANSKLKKRMPKKRKAKKSKIGKDAPTPRTLRRTVSMGHVKPEPLPTAHEEEGDPLAASGFLKSGATTFATTGNTDMGPPTSIFTSISASLPPSNGGSQSVITGGIGMAKLAAAGWARGLGVNQNTPQVLMRRNAFAAPAPGAADATGLRRTKSMSVLKQAGTKQKEAITGYCECCRENYDDLFQHIESKKHRKYATNSQVFQSLDKFIQKKLTRKTKEEWAEILEKRKTMLANKKANFAIAMTASSEGDQPPPISATSDSSLASITISLTSPTENNSMQECIVISSDPVSNLVLEESDDELEITDIPVGL